MDDEVDRQVRARRSGRRAGHGVIIVLAIVFIAASGVQIIPAVFGIGVRRVPSMVAGSPERGCALGVRSLATALDRAGVRAWSTRAAADDALDAFRRALAPEWNEEERVRTDCEKAAEGPEAWAALVRLKRAEEQALLHGADDLQPLRLDLAAHLPADLR